MELRPLDGKHLEYYTEYHGVLLIAYLIQHTVADRQRISYKRFYETQVKDRRFQLNWRHDNSRKIEKQGFYPTGMTSGLWGSSYLGHDISVPALNSNILTKH